MKGKILHITILLLFITAFTAVAQHPIKDNLSLSVSVSTKITSSNTDFVYYYQIINSRESQQYLLNFKIETGDHSLANGGTLTNFNLTPEVNWSTSILSEKAKPENPNSITLISSVASYGEIQSLDEAYSPPGSAIEPGDSIEFSFNSNGIPSIMRFWAQGWTKPMTEQKLDSLILEGYSLREISPKWYNNSFSVATIAPVLPDTEISPTTRLENVQDYLSQSCTELGWITNQGICRSLEAKLENVERQLDQGNTNAASGSLEAFINEVKAQKDKHLSSEAYALLYFNGEYLLEQISRLNYDQ